jgi:DNA-binding LytR/AlgR family response regulator
MSKIKTLIVEDEELFASSLEQILINIDQDIVVVAKLESIRSTVEWLQQNTVDLIFMDIQLSDGTSFEIFDKVEIEVPVVFLTSYDQYAIKAFKQNSIGYLLKPLNIEDLKAAITKFKKHNATRLEKFEISSLLKMMKNERTEYKRRFIVYVGEKIKYIDAENIAYFFIAEGEAFMRESEGRIYPSDSSLDKIQTLLDPSLFFRINRQYLINIKAIKNMYTYSKSAIKIELAPKPDEDIFVSLSRTTDFKRWLNQ